MSFIYLYMYSFIYIYLGMSGIENGRKADETRRVIISIKNKLDNAKYCASLFTLM